MRNNNLLSGVYAKVQRMKPGSECIRDARLSKPESVELGRCLDAIMKTGS